MTGVDPARLRSFLRTNRVLPDKPPVTGLLKPWGIEGCGELARPDTPDVEAFFAGSKGEKVSVFNLEEKLRDGFKKLRDAGLITRRPDPSFKAYCEQCLASCPDAGDVTLTDEQIKDQNEAAGVFKAKCISCHVSGKTAPSLAADKLLEVVRGQSAQKGQCFLVAPNDLEHSYLWKKLSKNASGDCGREQGRMPVGDELEEAQVAKIAKWIGSLPSKAGCGTCRRLISGSQGGQPGGSASCSDGPKTRIGDRAEGFAFMVSASLVDRVWAEVMGYPLTIANYFPRSAEQGVLLQTLTETTFIAKAFSLRELLVHILTSPYFNRRVVEAAGATPYMIEPVLDPWVEADPRRPPRAKPGWEPGKQPQPDTSYNPSANPGNHKNAVTETVRRYPAYSLIRSARTALGWPEPPAFFSGSPAEKPDREYVAAAGLYIRDAEPGFRGIDLQSLLNWETRNGACKLPPDVASDWIDRLIAEIGRVGQTSPARPVTWREAAAAVKDWLIGDLDVSDPVEAAAIARLLGWTGGPSPSAAEFLARQVAPGEALNVGLRRLCGVLLQSPQFQLGGMAEARLATPPHDTTAFEPRLRVCNEPDRCSYQQLCNRLEPALAGAKHPARCPPGPSSPISIAERPAGEALAVAALDRLCPPGLCYVYKLPAACRADPALCVETLPLCNPRFDACGAPLSPTGRLEALRSGAVLVAEADGAEVISAQSVTSRQRIGGAAEEAAPGMRLRAGDVVMVRPGQELVLDVRGTTGFPLPRPHLGDGRWRIQIDGVMSDATRPDTGLSGGTGPATGSAARAIPLLVTGPELREAMHPQKSARPPPWSVGIEAQSPWLRHGEAGQPIGEAELRARSPDVQGLTKRLDEARAVREEGLRAAEERRQRGR